MIPFFANNAIKIEIERVTDLVATQVEDNMSLSWTATDSAENTYKIYRSENGTDYVQVAETAIGETSYLDLQVGLNSEKEYWYYVVGSREGANASIGNIVQITTYYMFNLHLEDLDYDSNSTATVFRIDNTLGSSLFVTYVFEDGSKDTRPEIFPSSWTGFDGSPTIIKIIVPSLEASRITITQRVVGDIDFSQFTLIDADPAGIKGFYVDCQRLDGLIIPNLEQCSRLEILNYNKTGNMPVDLVLENGSGLLNYLVVGLQNTSNLNITNLNFDTHLRIGVSGNTEILLPEIISGDFDHLEVNRATYNGDLDFGNQFTGNFTGTVKLRYCTMNNFTISDSNKFRPTSLQYGNNEVIEPSEIEIKFGALIDFVHIYDNKNKIRMMDGNYQGQFLFGGNEYFEEFYFAPNNNNFSNFRISNKRWGVNDHEIDLSNFTGSFMGGIFYVGNTPDKLVTYPPNMGILETFERTSIENSGFDLAGTWTNWLQNVLGTTVVAKNIKLNIRRAFDQIIIEQLIDDITNNIAQFPTGPKVFSLIRDTDTSTEVISHFNTSALTKAQDLVTNHDYTITYWDGSQVVTL